MLTDLSDIISQHDDGVVPRPAEERGPFGSLGRRAAVLHSAPDEQRGVGGRSFRFVPFLRWYHHLPSLLLAHGGMYESAHQLVSFLLEFFPRSDGAGSSFVTSGSRFRVSITFGSGLFPLPFCARRRRADDPPEKSEGKRVCPCVRQMATGLIKTQAARPPQRGACLPGHRAYGVPVGWPWIHNKSETQRPMSMAMSRVALGCLLLALLSVTPAAGFPYAPASCKGWGPALSQNSACRLAYTAIRACTRQESLNTVQE